MDKKPISISFANQKGGIGKSTLTILAASWLRYVRGLNVLVVDCDFPQNSIVELREREKKAVMKNDAYKLMLQRQFERLQKKAYPVIRSTPENAENDVQVFLASESEPYDVVLYDLPGTMGTKGVIYTISLLNYLFIPMRADRLVMQSTSRRRFTINSLKIQLRTFKRSFCSGTWRTAGNGRISIPFTKGYWLHSI